MCGFSMFIPAVNVIVIISHTLGCMYTCIFIMEVCPVPALASRVVLSVLSSSVPTR